MHTEKTNEFLNRLLAESEGGKTTMVVVYLVNGIKLEGTLLDFDDVSIKMTSEKNNQNKPQLVMRQAISTIKPV